MPIDHLEPLRAHLRALPTVAPPKPWRRSPLMAVGGLRAVGFDRNSELLLVVSASGRSVVDCRTGEKVARDTGDYWEDEQLLEAEGIGPLAGKTLRVAGLAGGGLPLHTADGWSIELAAPDWPNTDILLLEPGSDLYGSLRGKPSAMHRLHTESGLRFFLHRPKFHCQYVERSCGLYALARLARPCRRNASEHDSEPIALILRIQGPGDDPVWSSAISGAIGGAIAAVIMTYIAKRAGKAAAEGRLRYGAWMWLLGVGCLAFAVVPITLTTLEGDHKQLPAVMALLVGFGVAAVYSFGEAALVRGAFDDDGIAFSTPWTRKKHEKWKDHSDDPNVACRRPLWTT